MNTNLNNAVMKTEVETFLVEEVAELIYDNEKLDQWNKHVQELGLTGQQHIVKPEKSPIPFLHMKDSLIAVFETLCPTHVEIERFDKSPIPVEILDLVALSKREEYFDKMQVWYDESTPDPCVVGWKVKPEFQSKSATDYRGYFNIYLLGRWADVKQSFEELTTRAKVLMLNSKKQALESKIKEAKNMLEDVEVYVNAKLGLISKSNVSLWQFDAI